MSTTIGSATQPASAPDEPVAVVAGRPAHHRSPDRLLLSVEEAAERLDIGRTLLFELIRTGQLSTIRPGRLRKVPVESLREFVEQQRGAP
jgi:excisionase family DNA binding protein